tara:strand:- start:294 stop:869 length:576 start_codon:yes stop_codon:yes gene_type:complete
MSNLFPTTPQWTALAELAYPKALVKDLDPHTDGEHRIDSLVRMVIGITRGSVLTTTAATVAEGKQSATQVFTLDDMAAMATNNTKVMSAKKRGESFQSGRTGWHGPIMGMVIPALRGIHKGQVLAPDKNGKPTPLMRVAGLTVVESFASVHRPYVLAPTGSHTVGLSALLSYDTKNKDATTVAVTTYIKPV